MVRQIKFRFILINNFSLLLMLSAYPRNILFAPSAAARSASKIHDKIKHT
jgi:hypothetical protein